MTDDNKKVSSLISNLLSVIDASQDVYDVYCRDTNNNVMVDPSRLIEQTIYVLMDLQSAIKREAERDM